ncbi:MAG: hypothetical protein AB1716_17485 [Planctomycetota bacterium]
MLRASIIALATLVLCSAAAFAGDKESAANEFARGKALLAKGDFDQALAAFKAATRADAENDLYFQEFTLLKRIIKIRTNLAAEQDADAWRTMARPVLVYYRDKSLSGPALELATTMHTKLNDDESLNALADARLAAGRNAEAAALLAELPEAKMTPHLQAVRGLALARTGQLEAARALAAALVMPKDCDADICWDAARLYGAVAQPEKALSTLTCLFECTPAPQLAEVKEAAKVAPEFARLVATPEFEKVLATKSKLTAGCGSSCAGCPSAGKAGGCSADKAKAEGKEAGCEHEKQ